MDLKGLSKTWIRQQCQIRDELKSARGAPDRAHLRSLVDRVLDRYEDYYRSRSDFARSDPARALSCPNANNMQRVAYWMSGLRPNIMIQLFYTESGFKFEAQLNELLGGTYSGDIGDISPAQLRQIDELQRRTIKDEMELDEELGRIRDFSPDPFPPSHLDLDSKMERVGQVMVKANGLRMRTLRRAVEILDPLQAVDLLVAAADLEIGVHELGLELERRPIRLGS